MRAGERRPLSRMSRIVQHRLGMGAGWAFLDPVSHPEATPFSTGFGLAPFAASAVTVASTQR